MEGSRGANDTTGTTLPPTSLHQLCFHSTGSLHVAERWHLVAPGLYGPANFKARQNDCFALKFHQSPRKD